MVKKRIKQEDIFEQPPEETISEEEPEPEPEPEENQEPEPEPEPEPEQVPVKVKGHSVTEKQNAEIGSVDSTSVLGNFKITFMINGVNYLLYLKKCHTCVSIDTYRLQVTMLNLRGIFEWKFDNLRIASEIVTVDLNMVQVNGNGETIPDSQKRMKNYPLILEC